ncbi:CubicO group peptidase (beta-lactamase class C family) [Chryseobacterium sp. H1D6B]|uniref:serine hydrolase domain-containing protein n=1 Tax=Chryseobacterium sp. H1D6B TaxID=2940588 RepID=UPI0015CE1ED9|nr:serine hydrolase domain-containing protein [Chryseobacterium sp. H1D6B]MDH6254081.1 CubicO group peptidase (beta-lactamase class C family) [Chryseobacterium sp. H1D6B]
MQISTVKVVICFQFIFCLILYSCAKKPEEIIKEYYKTGKFNGTVLIMKNNRIIYDEALGFSNFQTQEELTITTPFYIASLSKPFTAAGIIILQQKGLLAYDDKASKYLPELPDYAGNITIKQLLNHTSGIPDYESVLMGKKGLTNQDILYWLQHQKKLKFSPGDRFEYSNSGYIILSLIIEKVSGKSYSQFINENIFIPLNMAHTKVCDESRPFIENKAVGFNEHKQLDDYSILTTGDGGIYSTAEDLYKFDRALRSFSIINRENEVLLYTPPTLADGQQSVYGFGWFIDGKTASHTGGLNGFRALFWRDLQNNTTIIALTNQGNAFPLNNFLNDIKKSLK